MTTTDITPVAPTATGPFRLLWNVFRNVFLAMTGAYGLSLAGFSVLRTVLDESINGIGLMNNILHLMVLPSLILLPVVVLWRKWLFALTLIPAVWLFASVDGPQFIPGRTVAAAQEAPTLSVVTYNILARGQGYDDVATILRDIDADIVALQELTPTAANVLTSELTDLYPHDALHPIFTVTGQGILSKYPILEDEYWSRPFPFGHQRTLFDFDGERIVIYNTHPTPPNITGMQVAPRREQIDEVRRRAAEETIPVIITGDFNMTPYTEDHQRMQADGYIDAFQVAGRGLGYTFPNGSAWGGSWRFVPPLLRLDYVFYDAHWTALDARVLARSGGSDHYPMIATLAYVR